VRRDSRTDDLAEPCFEVAGTSGFDPGLLELGVGIHLEVVHDALGHPRPSDDLGLRRHGDAAAGALRRSQHEGVAMTVDHHGCRRHVTLRNEQHDHRRDDHEAGDRSGEPPLACGQDAEQMLKRQGDS
jgi:hypothetical protein